MPLARVGARERLRWKWRKAHAATRLGRKPPRRSLYVVFGDKWTEGLLAVITGLLSLPVYVCTVTLVVWGLCVNGGFTNAAKRTAAAGRELVMQNMHARHCTGLTD